MASIKFGNIVVDMKGKISGNVYSKNKGGAYSRVRVVPTNPQTSYQVAVRSRLTDFSQAWRGLTAAQRTGWNNAVVNFQRVNRIGDKHVLSGNALYVSLNKNLADVGLPAISAAPDVTAVDTVSVASAVADNSAQTVVITLDAVVPANTSIKVFVTQALSAGVSSPGTKLRQVAAFNAGASATLTLTTDYLARFGSVGAVGMKIFYTIIPVSEVSGQLGAPVKGVMTIVA